MPMPASVPRDAAGGNGPPCHPVHTRCACSAGNTTYHSLMGLSSAVMVGTAADVAEPAWPPADGSVPPAVARFSPAAQLRWFDRFGDHLGPQLPAVWDAYHCVSLEHRGECCAGCTAGRHAAAGCCCRAA